LAYLKVKRFPCIGAKATLARQQIKCMVAANMACPKDDHSILKFLYSFVDEFRSSKHFYHSAAIIFRAPEVMNERLFDKLLWQRLQALTDLDVKNYSYDKRVEDNPFSAKFSFSLKEEAFYIIGLHAKSSRQARQFRYPALVFNPHIQFEQLRKANKYEKMKNVVRKRDIALSGSVNPMLEDFGNSSEVYQYSGLQYDATWQCPLKINHGPTENNRTP
jgi:FPC/CPF motif-containing protein YcgG